MQVGDVVKLNSGGPYLTVSAVVGDEVTVTWFIKDEPQATEFNRACVYLVSSSDLMQIKNSLSLN